jgi:hypothetical protein
MTRWLPLLAALVAAPAHAYSAGELLADCQAAEAIYAGDRAASPWGNPRAARCVAYLEGFVDSYVVTRHLADSVGVKLDAFCLPEAESDLHFRVVRAVLAQFDRLPPNPENTPATIVAAGLSRAFPCTGSLERRK